MNGQLPGGHLGDPAHFGTAAQVLRIRGQKQKGRLGFVDERAEFRQHPAQAVQAFDFAADQGEDLRFQAFAQQKLKVARGGGGLRHIKMLQSDSALVQGRSEQNRSLRDP